MCIWHFISTPQDDSATRQFAVAARLNKDTAKELVRQTNDPAIASAQRRNKQRQEAQQTAREQRYRVVNRLRTTLNDAEQAADESATTGAAASSSSSSNNASEQTRQLTIVDIESQQPEPGEQAAAAHQQQQQQQQPADSDIGYVYDLYVPENEMQAAYVDLMDDNYLRFVLLIEYEQQTFNITNLYM